MHLPVSIHVYPLTVGNLSFFFKLEKETAKQMEVGLNVSLNPGPNLSIDWLRAAS